MKGSAGSQKAASTIYAGVASKSEEALGQAAERGCVFMLTSSSWSKDRSANEPAYTTIEKPTRHMVMGRRLR